TGDLDLLALAHARELLVALDVEALLLRLEVLRLDEDAGLLLDAGPLLLLRLRDLRELGQTLRVEGVVLLEVLPGGLIARGQGGGLELETVFEQVLADRLLHRRAE